MPVRKHRSVEDIEDAVWVDPKDPDFWRTISGIWELARRLSPPRFEPGVRKYRSIEEMDRAQAARERHRS